MVNVPTPNTGMRARRQYGEANLTQAGVVLILRSTSKQERRDALAAARTRHKGLPKIGLPSAQVWKPTPSCRSFNQAGSKKIITARAQEHRESMLFPINIAQPEVLKAEVIIEDLDMDLDEDLDVYLHVEFEATEDLEMVGVEPEIEVEEADLDALEQALVVVRQNRSVGDFHAGEDRKSAAESPVFSSNPLSYRGFCYS